MKQRFPLYDWGWIVFALYFVVYEGIALIREHQYHNDNWTLTHVISCYIPIAIRAALIAWLAYHFLIQHKTG